VSPVQIIEINTNPGVKTYQIPLTTTDGPAPFTVSYAVPSGQQWLSVDPPSGQAPTTVTISVDGAKLTGTSDSGTVHDRPGRSTSIVRRDFSRFLRTNRRTLTAEQGDRRQHPRRSCRFGADQQRRELALGQSYNDRRAATDRERE
jgi:hypothetical protein